MRLIYDMIKIKFKVEECDDDIYESDSEEDEKMNDNSSPVILSCVGYNTINMARVALQ